MDSIEPIRTFEQAIDRITEGIETSRLRRGDRLPGEADLARQLGISAPTLRQALRVMERAGLVKVKRGRDGGIFVAADLVPVELLSRYVAMEEEDVIAVLKARRVVEGGVTEVASKTATAEDFAEIERTNKLLERHIGNRPLVMRADAAFHRAVSRATHNPPLQGALGVIARDLAPLRDAYPGGEVEDRATLDIHKRQLVAMVSGDIAALRGVMEKHFRMLEQASAEAMGRTWDEVFGVETKQTKPRRRTPKSRTNRKK